MATFTDYLTTEGERVIARMLSGEIQLQFSKLVMGDGELAPGTSPKNVKAVISPQAEQEIEYVKLSEDNIVTVTAIFNNDSIETGFYFREKGLYATVDEKEVLVIYANNGSLAEWIEPSTSNKIEKLIRSVLVFSESDNLNIEISSGLFVSSIDFEEHLSDYNNPHKVTKEQIGLGNVVDGAVPVSESEINGNILADGEELEVYRHPGSGANPHETTWESLLQKPTTAAGWLTDVLLKSQLTTALNIATAGQYVADAAALRSLKNSIDTLNTSLTKYLPLAGGRMTGNLYPTGNQALSIGAWQNEYNTIYSRKFASYNTVDIVSRSGFVALIGSKVRCQTYDQTQLIGIECMQVENDSNNLMLKSSHAIYAMGTGTHCVNYGNTAYVPCYALNYPGPSDRRLKNRIQEIPAEESSNILLALRPVQFEFKNNPGKVHRGFVAQEVKAVLDAMGLPPQIYQYDDQKDRYYLDKTELIPDIVKMLQDHEERLRKLESKEIT